jgi:acyl dehydratase
LEVRAALPIDEPIDVHARLESVQDNGRRALIRTRVRSGTASAVDALVADMYALVPLDSGGDRSNGEDRSNGAERERPQQREPARVPASAHELAFLELDRHAGLDFAKLTGDFNPVHWIPSYARASGLRGTILQGFSTLARAIEALDRRVFAGDVRRLETIDVRFTGPLLLPARAGVYLDGGDLYVGDAPSGRAFLQGSFTTRKEPLHG